MAGDGVVLTMYVVTKLARLRVGVYSGQKSLQFDQ